MTAKAPHLGTALRCEDGAALVVEPGASPLDALLTLVEEEYGGERFAEDNPAILAALPNVRVERWFSCSKAYREERVEDPYCDDWWASDGDGQRSITVAYYDGSVYALGDDAEYAEQGEPA